MHTWLLALLAASCVRAQQDGALTPPYFNIAVNRKVTVNATCGEGITWSPKEVYCKLVGYDRLDVGLSKYDILDGQVKGALLDS